MLHHPPEPSLPLRCVSIPPTSPARSHTAPFLLPCSLLSLSCDISGRTALTYSSVLCKCLCKNGAFWSMHDPLGF